MKRATLKLVLRGETVRLLTSTELLLIDGRAALRNASIRCPKGDSANAGTGCPFGRR